MKISAFAPKQLADLPPIEGVRLAACQAGIKYQGREDLMLALFSSGTVVAGTLTRSKTASAAVDWCKKRLSSAQPHARALVVNSGNANAFTGLQGHEAVLATVKHAAAVADCKQENVFVASTGVIGEPLDPQVFTKCLAELAKAASPDAWEDAARAIMTTDTFAKLATAQTEIDGISVTINGFAKGAGMIAPDMATMLAFFFTDAPVSPFALQILCSNAVDESFNAITVDGDTSTSDTVLLFATGAAQSRGAPEISDPDDPRIKNFATVLNTLMVDLAQQIAKDGEGASKFITVHVEGAESKEAARRIAFSIANSPLVKTACAGEDPNWGRIVMAVGKSGEAANRDKLAIWFGNIRVAAEGEVDPEYEEAVGTQYMKADELEIRVNVGVGDAEARVWTCDLTQDYISINADYRS